MPLIYLRGYLMGAIVVCLFCHISSLTAAEPIGGGVIPPLNTGGDLFKPRFEELYKKVGGLVGSQKEQVIVALRLPEEALRATRSRITGIVANELTLTWKPETSSESIIRLEIFDTRKQALERLAWIGAMSNAPQDVVNKRLSREFGEVAFGHENDSDITMVRHNVLVRVYSAGKRQPVAEVVRTFDEAIEASVGLPRPEDGSRFMYPKDLLHSKTEVSGGICYRPFKKTVYALTCEKSLPGTKKFEPERGRPAFLILDYVTSAEQAKVARYYVTGLHFGFDLEQSPQSSNSYVETSPQGSPPLIETQKRDAEKDHLILEDDSTVRGLLFAPIFPEKISSVTVGSEWLLKIPPVTLLKEYAVLKHKWVSCETLFGFRCAKISYQIDDGWIDNENRETADYSLKGIVYFAIQEGVVVMETAHLDISGVLRGGAFQRKWRKNLILLHYEPLQEQNK